MADPLGALVVPAAAVQGSAASSPLQPQAGGSGGASWDTPAANGSSSPFSPSQMQQLAAATASPTSGSGTSVPAATLAPAQSPASRAQAFRGALASEVVNLWGLRALAFEGIPDNDRGLRAAVWRLLLGLLPPERAQWERVLRRRRAEYAQFCEELIVDPKHLAHNPANLEAAPGSHPNPLVSHSSGVSSSSAASDDGSGSGSGVAEVAAGVLQRLALSQDDHPLSTSTSSRWKAYFQDVEVQEQIERDVARTHPDMHFFSGGTGAAATHRAHMCRALFIFAKLNPGLRYVQGMNELYAPLYWLFRTDPAPEAAEAAEADAFFCFCDLMSEFRDQFCQQLDNSTVGIRATLARLSAAVRSSDEELWEHLERVQRINPQFYAFRWITLALTQEFSFPDAMRLWDSLLSDPAGRTDCLLRLCTAMLLNVRQELLEGDFASNMKLLQRYPPVDVHVILQRADALKRMKSVIVLD